MQDDIALGKIKKLITPKKDTKNPKTDSSQSVSAFDEIKPKENKFLFGKTTSYTYNLQDGTKVNVKDTQGVSVKQNSQTGEIFVSGLKDGNITCGKSGANISIYDSTLDEIKGSKKGDIITINNSTVNGKVVTWDIFDFLNNDDMINVINSTIEEINTGKGDNSILITNNSNVKTIKTGKGDDTVVISDSTAEEISTKKGNDTINISNSTVKNIKTGKGKDNVVTSNSIIEKNDISEKHDVFKELNALNTFSIENLDDISISCAQNNLDEIKKQYSDKELNSEEQYQLLAVNFFSTNLNNIEAQFAEQNASDGIIRNGYNIAKELTDLGISKEDINAAINEQKQMIDEMNAALNKESDMSFEDVFEKWTGVEYNKQNLDEYLQNAYTYSLAVNGIGKTESFKQDLLKADTLNDTYTLFCNYYGNEEKARKELNKLLQETIPNNPIEFPGIISIEINEKNELITLRTDSMDTMGNYPEDSTYTTTQDISQVTNMIRTMSRNFDLDKYQKEFKEQLENTLGYSFEALQNEYITSQLETFGKGNSFQKLIDRYCAEQEGFSDKLAAACQVGGIGLMVVGGAVTFVCPPTGVSLMSAGKYTSLAGMFSDNAIDLVDSLSSQNGISKDEAYDLFKETITEIALLYCGSKINGVSANVQTQTLNATQSKVLSELARLGTDASLSLLTDLMITGEINLTGEGINQILCIVTGLAGARVNEYNTESIKTATKIYQEGSPNEAYDYLKNRKVSNTQIYKEFNQLEINKALEIYKQTGDYNEAISFIQNSSFLNTKQASSEIDLLRMCSDLNSEYKNLYIEADNIQASKGTDEAIKFLEAQNCPKGMVNNWCNSIEMTKIAELISSIDSSTQHNEAIDYINNSTILTDSTKTKLINAIKGLGDYQYNSDMINTFLRKGHGISPEIIENYKLENSDYFVKEGYDILSAAVDHPMEVYRTVFSNERYNAEWEIGEIVNDKGFVSTSSAQDSVFLNVLRSAHKNEVETNIKIIIPKGSRVVFAGSMMQEVLIKNGSSFKVTAYDPKTNTYIWELMQ